MDTLHAGNSLLLGGEGTHCFLLNEGRESQNYILFWRNALKIYFSNLCEKDANTWTWKFILIRHWFAVVVVEYFKIYLTSNSMVRFTYCIILNINMSENKIYEMPTTTKNQYELACVELLESAWDMTSEFCSLGDEKSLLYVSWVYLRDVKQVNL